MTPRFDLNLLLLFDAIMAERNLTRAGQRLGLSQPAVSAAVARLRDLLSDPLFVRTSHGVNPTAKANRIAKPLSEALRAILELTSDELKFDPATSSRIFTIMMPDVGELNILPRLLSRIQRLPSDISISVAPISSADEGHTLEAGKVDLAIGNWPGLSSDRGFQSRLLFQDSFVCLVRSGHPHIGEKASLADLLSAAHIIVGRGQEAQSPISRLAGLSNTKWKIAARIPHYLGVPALLSDTDLVAIMPARPAALFSKDGKLRIAALAMATPTFNVNLYWHERFYRDPGLRWLIAQISDLFACSDNALPFEQRAPLEPRAL